MGFRLSSQTLLVLGALLADPEDWSYGYEISRGTGLKSGTLYPILMRLEERKLLEADWEVVEPGKPPRHIYRFTPEGLRWARSQMRGRGTKAIGRAAAGRATFGLSGFNEARFAGTEQ